MVLSEAEAESRLAALRREREALDRAITDLTLYLELGRRLTAAAPATLSGAPHEPSQFSAVPSSDRAARTEATDEGFAREGFERPAARSAPLAPFVGDRPGAAGPPATAAPSDAATRPADGARETTDTLPEGALARRYGRALIREAVAVLEAAGRPLHASEILAALTARGFTVPGQQDPVAALNTRLWKRAVSGGPLRRLGDAIYALAEDSAQADDGEG